MLEELAPEAAARTKMLFGPKGVILVPQIAFDKQTNSLFTDYGDENLSVKSYQKETPILTQDALESEL